MADDEKALAALRQKIDVIDAKLVYLLCERSRLSLQAGVAKGGRNIHRPEREAEVMSNVVGANRGPLSDEALRATFRAILKACRTIQHSKN